MLDTYDIMLYKWVFRAELSSPERRADGQAGVRAGVAFVCYSMRYTHYYHQVLTAI